MKKSLCIIAAVAFAGVAMADVAIKFENNKFGFIKAEQTTFGPTTALPVGNLVQLVWTASIGSDYQVGDLALTLANPGEIILGTTTVSSMGGKFNAGIKTYTDADVGGVDINSGYIFARVFDAAAPVAGTYFIEMGLQGPALTEYDFLNAGTIYGEPNGDILATNVSPYSLSTQGTQVIPEPATVGLLGVAGLGLFLARRKARS